jgi:hypothetical protein
MYQRDFILRMIEMFGELLAGLLGLIRKKDFEQASQSLENAYFDFLKQDASLFRSIEIEKLTDELIKVHHYTNGHLDILSGLFYAEAELLYAQGKHQESVDFYEKALCLLNFIVKESNTYSQEKKSHLLAIQNRIVQIKEENIMK